MERNQDRKSIRTNLGKQSIGGPWEVIIKISRAKKRRNGKTTLHMKPSISKA